MRIAACLEYDGSAFCGWQSQTHAPCVQIPVEAAFSAVADEPVRVVCAGRTDAGVHALCQVVHFDTRAARGGDEWRRGANANSPASITVRHATAVADGFHARRSAEEREYRYVIVNRRDPVSLLRDYVTWQPQPLDEKAMHRAAQALVGEHDFSSFRAAGCGAKTPVRCLRAVAVARADDIIFITVRANAFLQHMVRNIVGALLAVGRGEQREEWMTELLARRDRRAGGVTAPPHGLYLSGIKYPPGCGLRHDELWRGGAPSPLFQAMPAAACK